MSPDTPEADTPDEAPESASWPWSALGLPKMPPDARDIRRAYASALKQIDQARDPEGFAALRHAYDAAMSIREGRSQRNAQRRAVKAAKVAAITPAAEDLPTPAPPAPNTTEQDAQIAKEAAIRDMVAMISNGNLFAPASARILQALENPLSHAPEAQTALRYACAEVLRDMLRNTDDGFPILSPQITAEALLALDARFGWLNDYIAFRQDFGSDTALQHELATRAYGTLKQPDATQQQRSKFIPFNGTLLIVLMMIGGNVLRVVENETRGGPYENALTAFILTAAELTIISWIYTAQRKKRSARRAALLAGWFGLFIPLLIFAPDTDAGAQDRPLLLIWLVVTAILAAAWLLAPAWQWLVRCLKTRISPK